MVFPGYWRLALSLIFRRYAFQLLREAEVEEIRAIIILRCATPEIIQVGCWWLLGAKYVSNKIFGDCYGIHDSRFE